MTFSREAGRAEAAGPGAILQYEAGLERVLGDRALYRELLLRLRRDYLECGAWLQQALARGDVGAIQRKAHTLKGAAGMIGAATVCQLAGALEPAGAGPDYAGRVAALQAELDQLWPRIDDLLDGLPGGLLADLATSPPSPTDGAAQTQLAGSAAPCAPAPLALLRRLARLLDDGDGEAIDVLERAASPLAARLGVACYQEVAAAAHQFDFEAALAALAPALRLAKA